MGWLLAVALSMLTTQIPQRSTGTDGWNLGTKLRPAVTGRLTAVRYWRLVDDPGPHIGRVWSSAGAKLAEVTFAAETASGWQEQALPAPVAVMAGATVTVTVTSPKGAHYAVLPGVFAAVVVDPVGVTYPASAGSYGVLNSLDTFPGSSTPTFYFRDAVFVPDQAPPTPTLTITPDTTIPHGFNVDWTGLAAGPGQITITLRDAAGVVTTATQTIDLPAGSP